MFILTRSKPTYIEISVRKNLKMIMVCGRMGVKTLNFIMMRNTGVEKATGQPGR